MRRNSLETALGAVVLLVAAFFLWFAYKSANTAPAQGYELKAGFDSITGLNNGADVRISGIKIGSVSALELDPQTYRAQVTMVIDPRFQVPEGSSLRIASESLLGGKFISLEPGGSEEMLKPGGIIAQTQSSVDLEGLLGQAVFGMSGAKSEGGAPAPAPAPGAAEGDSLSPPRE